MPVNLGTAQGEITIGTRGVTGAESVVHRSAARMTSDLNKVGPAAARASKGVGGIMDEFNKLDNFLGAGLVIAGIVAIGSAIDDLAQQAANVKRVRLSFDRLAAGVGQNSDDMLASLRVSSRGMVSDANLVLNANRAMVTGVADTATEMGQLLEVARARGQAMGISTDEAFTRLTQGIGKREKEVLDELGIVVNLVQVYDEYAKKLGKTADALTEVEKTQSFFNAVMEDSADILNTNSSAAETAADRYDKHRIAVENLRIAQGELLMEAGSDSASFWTRMTAGLTEYLRALKQIATLGPGFVPMPMLTPSAANRMTRSRPTISGPRFGDSQEKVEELALDRLNAITDLERDSYDARKDAARDYQQSVSDTERDYQQNLSREARDFGRQRLRAELEQLDAIADVHRDAGRREVDAAKDLARTIGRSQADSAERIEDARQDASKRIVEMEEDYAKDRERAAEDHRDKLLSAAGRLDAIALLEERKRWARESSDAKEAHDEQRDDLQEQLDERIEDENESLEKSIRQAQEAHDRQLEDAREADAERIADMKADFEQRKRLEDEDRATRLGDMAEDHANQMAEMARQHALDLEQIRTNEAEKRAEIQAQFEIDLAEEIGRTAKQQAQHERMVNRALADMDRVARGAEVMANRMAGIFSPGSHPSTAEGHYTQGGMPLPVAPYNPVPGWQANSSRTVSVQNININADGLNKQEVVEVVVEILEELGN